MVSYTAIQAALNGKATGCLNPYCSGRWSRMEVHVEELNLILLVLILIVVEDGLVRA